MEKEFLLFSMLIQASKVAKWNIFLRREKTSRKRLFSILNLLFFKMDSFNQTRKVSLRKLISSLRLSKGRKIWFVLKFSLLPKKFISNTSDLMIAEQLQKTLIYCSINLLWIHKFYLQFCRMDIYINLLRINLEHQNYYRIFSRSDLPTIRIHNCFFDNFVLDWTRVYINFDIFSRTKTQGRIWYNSSDL